MSDYFGHGLTVSTTPTKVVDAVNYDREITIYRSGDLTSLGFVNNDIAFLIPSTPFKFRLPEDTEVWVSAVSSSADVYILVSR